MSRCANCACAGKYCRTAKLDQPLTPLSFVLRTPSEGSTELKADYELLAFRAAAAKHIEQRGEGMWIVKPAMLNRGRGIQVFSSPKEVEGFLSRGRRPNACYCVQKYIERPLLLDRRKFDIRQFVLLTSDHKLYMYKDSYVRTSSVRCDLGGANDHTRAQSCACIIHCAYPVHFPFARLRMS